VPGVTPVTMPEEDPIVALPLLPLHVPPPASVKDIVDPIQTLLGPVIFPGSGLTVTVVVAIQVPLNEYVTVVVPVAMPIKIPEDGSMVPTAALLLLHVPPVVASLNVVVRPKQTCVAPVIEATPLTTVTVSVAAHPLDIV